MRTLHMCMNVSGAIRNRHFKGLTDGNGKALTAKQAEASLRKLQAQGIRVIPLSKDCEGFSYQTGCPGHEIPELREESVSETHTPGEGDLLTSAIEAAALAGWMVKVLDGEEVSEFAESFEPVKRVAELIARNNGLEKGSAELFGALEQRNATIESDRATIAELLSALERFADRRCRFAMLGRCVAKLTNIKKCDRCHARAVIQKAKESR